MKKAVLLAATLVCLATALAQAADVTPPDALAKSVTEDVLAIVKADKDIQDGNQAKVAQLIEAKVLPHFDFARMTQLAMGRNWRQANADQQKALVGEFRALLVRTYASAFTQYKNQTVDYRPLKLAPTDTDVIVKSAINRSGGQPIAVDYSMEKGGQGWKVYDVKIEGISLVDNYRNTFNSEVQRNGVDGLIKALGDKNKQLQARK
jgi:phospholipid transport system substrate-binding protein